MRDVLTNQSTKVEASLFPGGKIMWDAVGVDQMLELVGNPDWILAAKSLVSQRHSHCFALRVLHHPRNFGRVGFFLAGLLVFGTRE